MKKEEEEEEEEEEEICHTKNDVTLVLLETFSLFDKDGDRSIDTREFITALRALGRNPTEAEVKAMIKNVDLNKNGKMEFEDFKLFVEKGRKQSNQNLRTELKEAFEIFAGDKQYIHKKDLFRICTKLGQEPLTDDQVNQIMKFADTDGDGKINIEGNTSG
ncbi:hypothetical protein KUTeg_000640 [Tegillarca granosa]|uniref:EF-hand domain-containing protein n=1 Tax=Tegillarca granosa TaxID=220873 RepID=A0ABQ9FY87_TEGGR|nr:hypothetical protein KUTeg_000640 [Tegillarca granosa]